MRGGPSARQSLTDPCVAAAASLASTCVAASLQGDPNLEQYAKGCLANMRQTILSTAAQKQEQLTEHQTVRLGDCAFGACVQWGLHTGCPSPTQYSMGMRSAP